MLSPRFIRTIALAALVVSAMIPVTAAQAAGATRAPATHLSGSVMQYYAAVRTAGPSSPHAQTSTRCCYHWAFVRAYPDTSAGRAACVSAGENLIDIGRAFNYFCDQEGPYANRWNLWICVAGVAPSLTPVITGRMVTTERSIRPDMPLPPPCP
jgi:hypothetical protein